MKDYLLSIVLTAESNVGKLVGSFNGYFLKDSTVSRDDFLSGVSRNTYVRDGRFDLYSQVHA